MSVSSLAQRRRDPRHRVPHGLGTIEFKDARRSGEPVRGHVTEISAVGFGFVVDGQKTPFDCNDVLSSVKLRFGSCALTGDIIIRNCRAVGPSEMKIGALFYPETARCQDRLLGVISGLALRE